MTTENTRIILNPSLIVFGFLLQEAILEGYRIAEEKPLAMFANQYEAVLVRSENKVKDATIDVEAPKKAGRPKKA